MLLLSVLLLLISAGARAQYCTPSYDPFGNCSANDMIDDFTLTGAGTSTISDLGTGCSTNGYDDRTTVVPAVDLQQGGTYNGTLSTVYSSDENVRIWIDFNSDQTFDPSEEVGHFGPIGSPGNPNPFSITLPFTAPVANNLRMRVRLVYDNPASSIDPCSYYFYGETHDYLVNVLATPACTGTPTGGTISPAGTVLTCNGSTFNLSVTGATFATGLTYQWEQSTNNGTTWVAASGGTGATTLNYTTPPITANIQYRLTVTCTGSSQAGSSTVVAFQPSAPSYASIPYFQDFENWISYCTTNDVPSNNWNNRPSTGDKSWRRDDQNSAWSSNWGNYYPASVSGDHSARWHSAALTSNDTGNLDLYLDCSAYANPNKQLYFYYINPDSYGDSLTIWLSTDGGTSFSQIGGYDTATVWTRKSLPIVSSSAQTILRFRGKMYSFFDVDDIGIDSVYVAPPCSGTPVAGTISPASPAVGCPGSAFMLSSQGSSLAGGLSYAWQQSTGGTWTAVTGGTGGTTPLYTTATLSDTIQYRLIVTCANSTLSDTTDPLVINVAQPVYATLPYTEGFESWATRCEPTDIPTENWTNTPSTGDQSWRRDDQGGSANWASTGGGYTPVSIQGGHSARFHTWNSYYGTTGTLDLYVDCSAPGNKELEFFHINDVYGSDSLKIFLSTDAGNTFSQIAAYDTSNAGNWTLRSVPFTSTSATTVLRFQAVSDYGNDMGIDAVSVLLPCDGTPNAGSVLQMTPCSGQNFNLQLTGNTLAAGLSYQWQDSTAGGGPWANLTNGNQQIVTTNITTPTYFRCIVTCTNGGGSDTTDASFFDLAAFYLCYCQSTADDDYGDDVGNVNIAANSNGAVILDNGVASPLSNNPDANNLYTNYTNLTPDTLFLDTNYHFSVTQINNSPYVSQATVAVFIDLNRDGQYDQSNEQVMFNFTDPTTQIADGTFVIPDTAHVGLTGMRVVLTSGTWSLPAPCGDYYEGETEDYLVYLSYPPCNGTPDGGTAYISDTLLCAGYNVTLTDTTHSTKRAGLSWVWESASSPNGPWAPITASAGRDTFTTTVTTDTYYRLTELCSYSGQSASSNVVLVKVKAPYKCYCVSYADGGAADVTDNGAFSIGNFVTNTGGPHLSNPTAVRSYTDWTDVSTAQLFVDSSYDVTAYQIMKTGNHVDAKVTLFIDLDNNHQYDIPQERLWTGYTSVTQPYISGTVSIPAGAVTGVFTGMRLIINEDTGPNVPSDEACGTYTSGETEDYVVKLYQKGESTTGVGTLNALEDVALYPNPTGGRFSLMVNASAALKDLDVVITNMTGQALMSYHYDNVGLHFTTEMDLSGQPRGVYFVELRSANEKTVRKLIVR